VLYDIAGEERARQIAGVCTPPSTATWTRCPARCPPPDIDGALAVARHRPSGPLMDDSTAELRCCCWWWCGEPLGEGSVRRRCCPRPRLCRDRAYRDRRRARRAVPERGALARAGYSLQEQLAALREVLLQAVRQEAPRHRVEVTVGPGGRVEVVSCPGR
jgi:hypothetical protein